MNIDSARALKAQLVTKQLQPLTVAPKMAATLGVAARAFSELERFPRTMALGIVRKSKSDFQLAVRIQNRALEQSPQLEAIRKSAKGEVDVRYVGRVVKRAPWNQSRQRPLLIGASVGHFRITAGTLGCFVKTRSAGAPRILSNNHVLADENRGMKGDAVIQPGKYDGGKKAKDSIGALDNSVKLKGNGVNFVDAAIASIKQSVQFDSRTLRGLRELKGIGPDFLDAGDEVSKVGRTTEVTHGRVTAFELDNVVVAYDVGNLRFDNQIEIEGSGTGPFSQGGDSGSLIVDADCQAVALLFAGGDQGGTNGQGLTFANPIRAVFDALKIDLLI